VITANNTVWDVIVAKCLAYFGSFDAGTKGNFIHRQLGRVVSECGFMLEVLIIRLLFM